MINVAKVVLENIPKGYRRALMAHNCIDLFQRKARVDKDPNMLKAICRQGCNHCCTLPVSVTDDEWDLLKKVMPKDINIDKAKKQASWGSEKKEWSDQSFEDRMCVFNDESNFCRVYEYRPVTCRMLLSTETVKQCKASVKDHTKQTNCLVDPKVSAYGAALFALSKCTDIISVRL